jgi:predicted ribonuclease YlaK
MKKTKETVHPGLLPQRSGNGRSKKPLEDTKRTTVYVLDTNVLLADPEVLFKLSGRIVIPMAVIGELDRFKSLPDARDPKAVAARKITRSLDSLGSKQDISKGARTQSGASVIVYRSHVPVSGLCGRADGKIVGAALKIKKAGRTNVTVLSNDKNLRTLARSYGITATGYPFSLGSIQPDACGRAANRTDKEKACRHETANPEKGFHVSWRYLLLTAAVIIAIALLTVGR